MLFAAQFFEKICAVFFENTISQGNCTFNSVESYAYLLFINNLADYKIVKNNSIDSVKLLFSITVVIMHGFLLDVRHPSYLTGLLTNGFFITAVPFYFIVSGYLFYKTIIKCHVKKWYVHIIRTYLIWSTVYAYTLLNIIQLTDASPSRKFYLILRAELTGVVHLWFIPSLITASLLCYLLRGVIEQKTKVVIVIIALIWLLGVALNWRLLLIHSLNCFWYKNGFFYGAPMFFLGFIFSRHETTILSRVVDFKKWITFSALLIIAESLITTSVINSLEGALANSMDMMMTTPLLSSFVFIGCMKKPGLRILNGMERLLSTFIYYSHILFLGLILWFFSAVNMPWSNLTRDMVITGFALVLIFIIGLVFKNKVRQII
ncbi:acyltransferase family protein [Rouxiella sp. WC2420]|uniref:Acyltransferase family protein n=1 Tax=Rouxiella sp. WC2420 TaxID=3234145 RepID=A0AB39W047_9GAMM